MAFYITSDISIGDEAKVKVNKVSWKTEVGSFIDTCAITLPRAIYLKDENKTETQDLNGRKTYQFKEGDKVVVKVGYNNKNEKRFEGFVRLVKMGIPVELQCEGYGYQLYDVIFNKTYTKVSVKELLKDLTEGTEIILSDDIPDIPLKNVRFKNATGIQVLEWLKSKVKLSVYFNFNELYVGTLFGKSKGRAKVRIGWNTIKDDNFQKKKVDKNVKVVIREKNEKGEVKKTKSDEQKYSNEKEIKVKAGLPTNFLKEIANRLQTKDNYKGYEGSLSLFLVPYITKGMVLEVDGGMYPEKTGEYFVESVSGEVGMGGGRQTPKLGFLMSGTNGNT